MTTQVALIPAMDAYACGKYGAENRGVKWGGGTETGDLSPPFVMCFRSFQTI